MKEVVTLDLFSGIGGFSKGFIDAGMSIRTHYYSEIDKHAIAIYKYQFPNSQYVGSVTTLDGRSITRPNIITFGSPCQDFSVAGKRAGLEGQRSSLIGEAIRLITECRPDVFVWENVKGVFSSNNGEDFWAVIQAFANIGGYRLEWQLLNTSWFLPQNRERIYLVGHLAKPGRNFKGIFPIRESDKLFRESAREEGSRSSELCSTVTSNLKRGVHGGGGTYIIQKTSGQSITNKINVTGTLQAGGSNVMDKVPNIYVGDYRVDEGMRIRKDGNSPTIPARAREDGSGQPIVFVGGLSPHNRGDGSKSRDYSLQERVYDADNSLEAATISATMQSKYLNNSQIRRLTEIECERLQGFPDNWTEYGDYDGVIKKVPKTQRYKALGNAVTVAVVKEIAKLLIEEL